MSYTDLTTEFESGDLFTWQHFQQLADNDEYKHLDSNTTMLFLQAAAPTGWTKLTGANNRALRVVDGAGGATGGGSTLLGSVISLAHAHTVSGTHVHSVSSPSHTHNLDTETSGVPVVPTTNQYVVSADSDGSNLYEETAGGATIRRILDSFGNNSSVNHGAANAGTPDSQLSDITFKYQDAIIARKD